MDKVYCSYYRSRIALEDCASRKYKDCARCPRPAVPEKHPAPPSFEAPKSGRIKSRQRTKKQAKPRWGWDLVDAIKKAPLNPLDFLTEEQLLMLADQLGVELTKELAYALNNEAAAYQYSSSIIDNEPRPSEQKAALDEIRKHANALAGCLDRLDSKTHELLKESWLSMFRKNDQIAFLKRILRELEPGWVSPYYVHKEPFF